MDEHAGDTVHGKAIISTRSWRQTWVPKFPFYPKFTEPQWHSDIGINFTIEGQRQLSSCFIRIPGVSLQTFPVLVIHFFFFFNISHDTAYHRREFILKKQNLHQKYLNNCQICYRHSWSREDCSYLFICSEMIFVFLQNVLSSMDAITIFHRARQSSRLSSTLVYNKIQPRCWKKMLSLCLCKLQMCSDRIKVTQPVSHWEVDKMVAAL